jgi:hypothetical protein
MGLGDRLDLELAWKKNKYSSKDRLFIDRPYVVDLLDKNRDSWIEGLSEELDGGYNPQYSRVIDLPKTNYHVRPASILNVSDSLFYTALLIDLYDDIKQTIEWSEGSYRFSHILKDDIQGKKWLEYYLDYWENWNEISRNLIQEDYEYVLFSDIAGFYENISIKRLTSDLRQVSDKNETINSLRNALQTWAQPRNSGLPQGYYPSDILAELYHNSIDKRLKNNGYRFLRYNDDLRIFTETEREAKLALKRLSNLYREKGLNLHSAKTCILSENAAEGKIDEVDNNIKKIQKAQEVNDIDWEKEWESITDYGSESNKDQEADTNRPDKELIENAFRRFYIEKDDEGNKHLFRFLISNLGYHKSPIAVGFCINHIRKGGSDVSRILDNYFSELDNKVEIANELAKSLINEELIYPYHKFYIIKWFFEQDLVSNRILTSVRHQLNLNLKNETKNYCIAYLGENGDASDLDRIQKMYQSEVDNVTKSIIVLALRNLEKSRRNSFYSRVEEDNEFVSYAVKRAKNTS